MPIHRAPRRASQSIAAAVGGMVITKPHTTNNGKASIAITYDQHSAFHVFRVLSRRKKLKVKPRGHCTDCEGSACWAVVCVETMLLPNQTVTWRAMQQNSILR